MGGDLEGTFLKCVDCWWLVVLRILSCPNESHLHIRANDESE